MSMHFFGQLPQDITEKLETYFQSGPAIALVERNVQEGLSERPCSQKDMARYFSVELAMLDCE